MQPTAPLSRNCTNGRHRARRVKLVFEAGVLRSVCRDCGCPLMRTQATRRWFYAGTLGAA